MYLSKVKQQSAELLKARERNTELKKRYDFLKSQCETNIQEVIATQLKSAETEENRLVLLKQLTDLKKQTAEKKSELLEAYNKLKTFTNTDSFLPEIVDKIVGLLHEELMEIRLKNAENEVENRELQEKLSRMTAQVRIYTEQSTKGEIRERMNYLNEKRLEFKDLKQEIADLKIEIEKHKKYCATVESLRKEASSLEEQVTEAEFNENC